MSEVYHSLLHL